jgi:hypothetical protein
MSAANKQCYALQCLGNSLRKANMDMRARTIMDETLSKLCDDVGACERIFKTPIPVIYTRHTSRYVGLWLGLLPFAIWGVDSSWNHLITIPSCMVITFFLLGIEELGLQIEEPFSILPIEAFCDASIGAVLIDMIASEDKSRGLDKVPSPAVVGVVEPTPSAAVPKHAVAEPLEPSPAVLEASPAPTVESSPKWKQVYRKYKTRVTKESKTM